MIGEDTVGLSGQLNLPTSERTEALRQQLRRRARPGEDLIEGFIALNGVIGVGVLLGIVLLLLREGAPVFGYVDPWHFFTGDRWYPVSDPPVFGMLPFFVATLWVTLGATVISVPIGVAAAAYLSEAATPWVRETVKPLIELLAGIPSVVLGFIGLAVLSTVVRDTFGLNTGLNGLTASVVLALMSLPVIVSVSEDAMSAVPREYREAGYALGCSQWQTIAFVIIPAAFSGITAAVMLGIGRAVGETMTALMIAGGSLAVPTFITQPMRPMTATIAAEINNAVQGGTQYQALFAIGMVLFAFTFAVNLIADLVLESQKRRFGA